MAEAPFTIKTNPFVKWTVYLVLSVFAYLGYAYLQPHITSYNVKTALKTACVGYVRESRDPTFTFGTSKFEPDFLRTVNSVGVPLATEQYAFSLSDEADSVVCTGKAAFKLRTSWPFLQPVLGKDYQFTTTHRPVSVYKWRRQF